MSMANITSNAELELILQGQESMATKKILKRCETKHTPAEWEAIREEFSALVRSDLYTLKQIMGYFHDLGFDATERQFKRKIETWGLEKKLKASEKDFMVRKEAKRLKDGKETTFWVNGRLVDQRKLTDARKKLFSESWIVRSIIPTPKNIKYKTPQDRRHISDVEQNNESEDHFDIFINDQSSELQDVQDFQYPQSFRDISHDCTVYIVLPFHAQTAYRCHLCHFNTVFGHSKLEMLAELKQHLLVLHSRTDIFIHKYELTDSEALSKGLDNHISYWSPNMNGKAHIHSGRWDQILEGPAWDHKVYGPGAPPRCKSDHRYFGLPCQLVSPDFELLGYPFTRYLFGKSSAGTIEYKYAYDVPAAVPGNDEPFPTSMIEDEMLLENTKDFSTDWAKLRYTNEADVTVLGSAPPQSSFLDGNATAMFRASRYWSDTKFNEEEIAASDNTFGHLSDPFDDMTDFGTVLEATCSENGKETKSSEGAQLPDMLFDELQPVSPEKDSSNTFLEELDIGSDWNSETAWLPADMEGI